MIYLIISNIILLTALLVIGNQYGKQQSQLNEIQRSNIMTLQETLDSANASLAAAQATQSAAQAAFDAAQPHLGVLAEIEAEAEKLSEEAKVAFTALIAKGRALLGMA